MRPIEIQPTRQTPANDKVVAIEKSRPADAVAKGGKDVEVHLAERLKASEPPIDTERVKQIRDAIASGTYPLTPAKMADAMIAARILLRNSQ